MRTVRIDRWDDLIERARLNDFQAWRRLLQKFKPLVRYWCRRDRCLGSEDVADVVQAVFLTLARKIGDFQNLNDSDTLCGWLRVVTTSKIKDHLRREQRQPKASGGTRAVRMLAQISCLPAEQWSLRAEDEFRTVRSRQLNQLLGELRLRFGERSWAVFWEAEIEGRQRRDIAEEFDMSVAAVNQAVYRIRKRLRQEGMQRGL